MNKNSLFHVCCYFLLSAVLITGCSESEKSGESDNNENEWVTLWDGETFENWRASENKDSFSIEDGKIVADGPRSHLFYEGPVAGADFDNFEFRADVYTYPNSNSGIFFHTEYQEEGWPEVGYEAQVNATQKDPRKTGSLYAVNDVKEAPHKDEEWFTYHIIVEGQQITFKINDKVVMEFTEPAEREGPVSLGSGTIALQAHDPDSRVYYRNLQVRVPESE